MALETPIAKNGYIQLSLQEIFSAPIGTVVHLNSMRFVNTVDEAFILEVYQFVNGIKSQLLYRFELDAGDIVVDDTTYQIHSGIAIYAKSDVATVSYMINANQQVD